MGCVWANSYYVKDLDRQFGGATTVSDEYLRIVLNSTAPLIQHDSRRAWHGTAANAANAAGKR